MGIPTSVKGSEGETLLSAPVTLGQRHFGTHPEPNRNFPPLKGIPTACAKHGQTGKVTPCGTGNRAEGRGLLCTEMLREIPSGPTRFPGSKRVRRCRIRSHSRYRSFPVRRCRIRSPFVSLLESCRWADSPTRPTRRQANFTSPRRSHSFWGVRFQRQHSHLLGKPRRRCPWRT